MDGSAEIAALVAAAGAGRCSADGRLVVVRGPDAADFLHRLCTQDVTGMPPGDVRPAAFLTGKGRVLAVAILARTTDAVWVEVPAAAAADLAELLERYHFAERLEVAVRPDLEGTALIGPGAAAAAEITPWAAVAAGDALTLAGERHGVQWVHRYAPAGAAWPAAAALPAHDPALVACLRLWSGRVVAGVDTDDRTLALEAPLEDHVSTTKGCYVGQEIVARIHTYGHVNRRVVLVRVAAGAVAGTAIVDGDGDPVGTLRTVAPWPGRDFALGWALLPALLVADPEPIRLAGAAGAPVALVRG